MTPHYKSHLDILLINQQRVNIYNDMVAKPRQIIRTVDE
jgi:hypothetical protein